MTKDNNSAPTALTDEDLAEAAGGFPGEMLDGDSDDEGDTAFPGEMLSGSDESTPTFSLSRTDLKLAKTTTDLKLNVKPKYTFNLG